MNVLWIALAAWTVGPLAVWVGAVELARLWTRLATRMGSRR